jgi:Exportin-5 family/Exportin 1-like protein
LLIYTMDIVQQQQILFKSIAIASLNLSEYSAQEHQESYRVLEEFKTLVSLNIQRQPVELCLSWIQQVDPIVYQQKYNITTATKLLALEVLDLFFSSPQGYAKCSDEERLQIRISILNGAQVLSSTSNQFQISTSEIRILARKVAVVLKGLILRDFPQRWMTLGTDFFAPSRGLWNHPPIGVQICLECFKLVAEDCTDSDFNVKISTTRRNDVLQGLNEISTTFLPMFFQCLEHNYPLLQQSKTELHNMHAFLLSENRTIQRMTPVETSAYEATRQKREEIGQLLSDTLVTLEKFCSTLPVSWMLGGGSTTDEAGGPVHNCDFVAAFLHFLREPYHQIQIRSIECIEQLAIRGKLDLHQWLRLTKELPIAFQDANQSMAISHEYRKVEVRAQSDSVVEDISEDALAVQVDFHRALSRLLSCVTSSHVAHISSNKHILTGKGVAYENVNKYLRLLVDILQHPSGRIATEQINVWSTLFRDPQISKSILLRPLCTDILTSFMDQMIRVRWEDIEDGTHPRAKVIEASFDDEDEYDAWMGDLRSRASLLFRYMGNAEPQIISQVLHSRVKAVLAQYGNGTPLNFLEPFNSQLTIKSDAVMQFEALFQPLDSALSGMPSWSMIQEPQLRRFEKQDSNDRKRSEVRAAVRANLSEIGAALTSWAPSHVWLKFRHTSLLESLKHYWQYDPSSLLQGVDTLIRYLGLPDEWNPGMNNSKMSDEMVGLKKRSGVALVSVAKKAPHHLVPWLSQLSEATRTLLTSDGLIPMNQMHLYEFLSCVATAVENPHDRSRFLGDVLSDAVAMLESAEIKQGIQSTASFLSAMGVLQVMDQPDYATNPSNVAKVNDFYSKLFTPLNRLLSVGRRCNEVGRQRSVVGGIPIESLPPDGGFGGSCQLAFPPDEGPLSLQDLALTDPFVPIWPRILPTLLQVYEVTLSVWRPENQASFLQNSYQRYLLAISDDEAYLARTQNSKSGGVFGEGGAAGSVCSGTDRRETNLVPKWSGWFNELRNTCLQLFGLLAAQRVLYAPEIAPFYPRIVSVLTNPLNLKSMEHRHFTQFLKHVVEFFLLCCPCSLYPTHLAPIIGPIIAHIRYRLEKTWLPLLSSMPSNDELVPTALKALNSADCSKVAHILNRGEDEWFSWYYAHAGLFVGDLDAVTSEAAVEKYRVDVSRTYTDMMLTTLALKGDWALVLANQAREELAIKKNDPSILAHGPSTRFQDDDGIAVNADGTPKRAHQAQIDARKLLRINGLCHFLLLENEGIAGDLTLTLIQCLGYPDAYTCRRTVKICHRMLETVSWSTQYSHLIGQQMFTQAVKNVVTEPKWMVGMEWDMINVVRDIYCRLVLGQLLQAGGQGPGQQQGDGLNGSRYEQAKTVDKPLQGGGILVMPSSLPRQILASLPGIGFEGVEQFEATMKSKRSAKDQKDCIRDLLRIAADAIHPGGQGGSAAASSIFDRAVAEESLLHANSRAKVVPDLPKPHATPKKKVSQHSHIEPPEGLVAFQL